METSLNPLTPRQRCIAALERRPLSGRVPHFELVFYLTIAERYEHSAIFVQPNPDTFDECARVIELIRLAKYELMLDVWRKEGNYP